jgi:hypothetical protein
MANRMNYDNARRAGRPTEMAFAPGKERWHANQAARPASAGRSIAGEARAAMEIEFDETQRDTLSKKRELITLTREPEIRDTPKGRVVVFRGTQEGRDKPIVAALRAPVAERHDDGAREDLDRRLRDIGGGDKVSLSGTWAKRRWEQDGVPREFWEFQAQRFQPGDVPLERMLGRQTPEAAREPTVSPAARALAESRSGRGM